MIKISKLKVNPALGRTQPLRARAGRRGWVNPKAVIFDMDGVVVDSMPYHFIAWYEALKPLGVRVNCLEVYSREGERWEKTLRDLLSRYGIRPSKATLRKIFLKRARIFKKYFKGAIFKDVEPFLDCLRNKGYFLGLVTGTPAKEINHILPQKIKRLFDYIVAGDNVKKGKPSPEPYLRAARQLKVKPSQCLVIENAPLGIESAKRAGMFCVALTTSLPKEYLRKADIIVDKLEEITGVIESSCAEIRRIKINKETSK